MILYIHGFASSAKSNKVTMLKQRFEKVIALDLSPEPDKAINQLQSFIEKHNRTKDEITLVGSSLGGYYAMYLSTKYQMKAVLINPAINPWKTLANYADKDVENYSTNQYFTFKNKYLQELQELKTSHIDNSKILLLLKSGDETLDYREAIDFLPNAKIVMESGGSHQFENFDNYFEMIQKFIDSNKTIEKQVKNQLNLD